MFKGKTMFRTFILMICIVLLAGCSAALVPYTSDPKKKIDYAYWLFVEKDRAIPAERLLHEAMLTYKENKDESGLAEANEAYGVFLRSYALAKYEVRFREKGFLEKNVTFDNRLEMSLEYLKKAKMYYESVGALDALSNVCIHIGITYLFAGNKSDGCGVLDASKKINSRFVEQNPEAEVIVDGVDSFDVYVDGLKKKAGCVKF
jgi:hypothetical protein